jgi:hypothetical protein
MVDHTDILLGCRAVIKTLAVADTGTITLAATTTGYTRVTGSFLTDGFIVGMEITPTGFSSNPVSVITAVSDLSITVDDARTAQAAAAGRRLVVTLPVNANFGNLDFPPPDGRPFVEEDYVPAPHVLRGLIAAGTLEVTSFYMVRWFGLVNVAKEHVTRPCDALCRLFRPGTQIALTGGEVAHVRGDIGPSWRVHKDPKSERPVGVVSIPLRVLTLNS